MNYRKTGENRHMETEQHATKQQMGQWRNQGGNEKITLRQMKIETQLSKICWTHKCSLRCKSIAIQAYLKKHEKSQTIFTPKGTRKRQSAQSVEGRK